MYIVMRHPVNLGGRSFFPRQAIPKELEPLITPDVRKACVQIADPPIPDQPAKRAVALNEGANDVR